MSKISVVISSEVCGASFKDLFPQAEFYDPRKHSKADLVIFTGGQDVNPSRYGQMPEGAFGWDDARDSMEMDLLAQIRAGVFKCRKVFGSCRGLQVLGVNFGYGLEQHINPPHSPIHQMEWELPFVHLSKFTQVNSMHHQAVILSTGGHMRVLAKYKKQVEAATFMSDERFFGVQWHPEWMSNAEEFFDIITRWTLGEINLWDLDMKNLGYHPSTGMVNRKYSVTTSTGSQPARLSWTPVYDDPTASPDRRRAIVNDTTGE